MAFGTWKVRFADKKNSTTQSTVTVRLVPKTIAATRYAPFSNATIPARIESTPPAKTSVTISRRATHDAFEVCTPRFFI